MSDQGYPSRRQRSGDQPHRKKRSNGQPRATATSTEAMEPMSPQDHSAPSQPLNEPVSWENDTAMDWEQNSSGKLDSISSYTTSYLNADTPSGGAANTMGGYVMVQNRSSSAYSSSGSHITSEEASEQGHQAYYSPPSPATGSALEREALHSDSFVLSPHESQWILSDLETQKSEPQYNAYDPHQAVSSSVTYQEFPDHYSLHTNYQTSTTESSFPASKSQEEPWNQTVLRVPRYEPSFTAFGLSPEPEVTLSQSPSKSRTPHKKSGSRSATLVPGPGRKEKPASPGWEHIVVEKGGLKTMNEGKYDVSNHNGGGRRKGKLPKDAKEKAARVRRVKACWTCWLLKVPCSEGEVCERCLTYCSRKSIQSPSTDQLCSRTGFIDYEETFFPDYLHFHLDKQEIKTLIDEHSLGFTGNGLQVEISTGSAFTPMKLEAHFFKPKHGWDSELLRQHRLTVESEEQKSMFLLRYSAPVGLMALSTTDVKKTLREHVEQMVLNSEYTAQTTAGDAAHVPSLILEEVRRYCAKTKSSLVRSALMLHAIHYFMGSLATFTPDSAATVYDRLPVPPEPYLSSRLLNRQLKFVMHRLHREITRDVLEGLEKSMRSRTKDAWGPCFAAILVLCLCIEGLQTAADTFVVCDKIKEQERSEYSREQSRRACENVEVYPYERCTMLFHEIFKTKKEGNGGARDGGFNPLKSLECGLKTGLDPSTDLMVKSIYGWVGASYDSLQELSQRPILLNYGYNVEAKDIKVHNTGRLAAKFLVSFFAKDI